MKKFCPLLFVFICFFLLASCAPGPNGFEGIPGSEGKPAGFLLGIWHGAISCISFILSLFSDDISVYEVHNNGGWYNFGFILGILMAYGGGGHGAKRRK